MTRVECAVCKKKHEKADGVVTVGYGCEWRFCSEDCRERWRESVR